MYRPSTASFSPLVTDPRVPWDRTIVTEQHSFDLGKEIRDLKTLVTVGFAKIDGKFTLLESKFTPVESKLSGLQWWTDLAGWAFVGYIGGHIVGYLVDVYMPEKPLEGGEKK